MHTKPAPRCGARTPFNAATRQGAGGLGCLGPTNSCTNLPHTAAQQSSAHAPATMHTWPNTAAARSLPDTTSLARSPGGLRRVLTRPGQPAVCGTARVLPGGWRERWVRLGMNGQTLRRKRRHRCLPWPGLRRPLLALAGACEGLEWQARQLGGSLKLAVLYSCRWSHAGCTRHARPTGTPCSGEQRAHKQSVQCAQPLDARIWHCGTGKQQAAAPASKVPWAALPGACRVAATTQHSSQQALWHLCRRPVAL